MIKSPFSIFNDKLKAIDLCIARFDDDTKAAFLDLYTKVDDGVINSETEENNGEAATSEF